MNWIGEGLRAGVFLRPRVAGRSPVPREMLLLVVAAIAIEVLLARLEVPGAASFNLRGWLANGRESWRAEGPYPGDEEAYPVELPPLARPKVKVAEGRVFVWTARS